MPNTSEDVMKNVTEKVASILMDLDTLNGLSKEEKDRLNVLASQVVGLRDTAKFNVAINIDREDIKRLRRDLASAISAEKFVSGFMTAIQLLAAVGAI